MNRRCFLKTIGFATVSTGAFSILPGCASVNRTGKAKRKRPNIVYILADDLGYGDLGCYGQKNIKTPCIDQMAAGGMRFTQHYAGSTVCAPSRSCLMTGLHTGHTRVRGNEGAGGECVALQPQDITVAELLKKGGYTTGVIGKWGLGEAGTTGIPNKKGFDYWFGYLNQRHAHNYYPEFLWRNEEKYYLTGNKLKEPSADGSGVSVRRNQYSHDLFTKEALVFIEHNRSKPFFLYLAYTIPHTNNEAGEKGMEVPDYGIYRDKNWPESEKGRAAMITRMDGDVGKILNLLKKLDIDEDTLVIFTSDNGPHKEGGTNPKFFNSSGRLRGIKRDLYEGGIRVPMVARWLGKIKSGSVSNHISAFWDLLPTCAELAGGSTPKDIDGISMVPTLLGEPEKQKEHKFLYWEFHKQGGKQAVRTGDWKGVRIGNKGKLELYNLKTDISEKHNVAKEHLEIVARIERYLKTARVPSKYFPCNFS
jgi:uncharacterized sulfatase